MAKRRSVHSKARRLREHLFLLVSQYVPCCYVCGDQFDAETFCSGDASDGITWHHIDMRRDNDAPDNLAPCHRACHRSFHIQLETKGVDIRTPEAVEHWGPTPKALKSCRTRSGGAIKRTT